MKGKKKVIQEEEGNGVEKKVWKVVGEKKSRGENSTGHRTSK